MTEPPIALRVRRFLTDPTADTCEALARAAFAFQYEKIEPYRRLCERRGVVPRDDLDPWETPAVPVAAFKTLVLEAAPAVEIFRSSGTTGSARSVHHHPFPELYRHVIDASFPGFCLPRPPAERTPILSLVPTRSQIPDSSLGFMVDHILGRFGDETASTTAIGPHGVELDRAAAWCAARLGDGRAGLILATAFALVEWLDALATRGERLALPPGTVVFETGGFKGRVREITRHELLAKIEAGLGVPAGHVVREYGMTELTSQLYTRVLDGGDSDLFVTPHWLRYRVLDPETLRAAPLGRPGIVSFLDLANLGSAIHLLTEDLGIAEPGGLRLTGRASGAELRGCSLTVEELGWR